MSEELLVLNALEVRVLGCLMEKQLLTPDVYPLTLNSIIDPGVVFPVTGVGSGYEAPTGF